MKMTTAGKIENNEAINRLEEKIHDWESKVFTDVICTGLLIAIIIVVGKYIQVMNDLVSHL